MPHARIIGTGAYLPPREVANAEIGGLVGLSPAAIRRLTGIRTRRWALSELATSDLAEHAARAACRVAGIAPADLDAILVSTTSPDMGFPSTACLLQHKLGLRGAAAFDLAASCSGFLYGLSMADRLIRAGQFARCLVVAAEIKSRVLDRQDRATVPLFGDGAGAAVVVGERTRGEEASKLSGRLLGIRLYADGTGHDLITVPAGGSSLPTTADTVRQGLHSIRMNGGAVYRRAVRRLGAAVADTLDACQLCTEDLDLLIFHQANGRILQALDRRLGLPADKVHTVIEQTGNTSSASLPIALDDAVRRGRIHPGSLVLLGTFGGGLTWATALIRWENASA